MNNQNLLIYDSQSLYEILNEVSEFLNFNLINISKENFSIRDLDKYDDYIILVNKNSFKNSNQLIFNEYPIKISKLIEKINIEFLKKKFNKQSDIKVGSYVIDINSRVLMRNDIKLDVTEKEINTIIYLVKNNKPISIKELQENVWGHQSKLETHTVETHIHRLRKKIKDKFNDDQFIISKEEGYLF